ncbi:MAG: YebC/PmpR family DNA-binding transcriptional regulator [Firmicutes bacterium]|nr:YebC/PmpR family DNA-binding transcriptional regulator [Bacillota bacterium]
MSGHSKWANIKHRKEKSDAQRAKAFTKVTREIIVAARQGGGDPETNFRLRLAIQRARAVNMPNENIIRAIKRGVGHEEGTAFEEVTYEGYGPGGVALMVKVLTDNRNRSVSEVRHIFSRFGGNLGEAGCVSWMFEPKGLVTLGPEAENYGEEELLTMAMEAGAEDLRRNDDVYLVVTAPDDLEKVRRYLEEHRLPVAESELAMVPKSTVEVAGREAEQLEKLLEALDDHDDVQEVYGNYSFASA